MTRRRKILLLALCSLIAVVAVCFFTLHEREPSYNGRTLSEWLERSLQRHDDVAKADEADAAVRAIGTNAVPFLLKWGTAEEPEWRREIHNLLIGHPKISRWNWTHRVVEIGKANRQILLSERGFEILGTNALPCLRTFVTNSNPNVRSSASNCVYWLEHVY